MTINKDIVKKVLRHSLFFLFLMAVIYLAVWLSN
jgi:hypothetical protein